MPEHFRCRGRPLSLIVLAGGQSRRMGTDKAFLPSPEGRLIDIILKRISARFSEVILSVSSAEKFRHLEARCIEDDQPGRGPMMGLKTCLSAAAEDKSFVLACDIPEFDVGLIERLVGDAADWDIVVPLSPDGFPEPLFGVYSKRVIPEMERLLGRDERSLVPLLENCRTRRVPLGPKEVLRNLNRPEDYLEFLAGRQADRGRKRPPRLGEHRSPPGKA